MEFINSLFSLSSGTTIAILGTFIICFLGYLLGSVKVKGLCLGTAGVFLVALLVGYLCTIDGLQNVPVLKYFFVDSASHTVVKNYKFIESIGLVLFVTAVGFIAGPNFFRDLKKNAKSYVPLGAIIIAIGAFLTVVFARIPGIGADFSNGILSGALTSTPAFSASKAVAENEGLVALGHAIAYPFGVVGVVLFVQIMPRLMKADMAKERNLIVIADKSDKPKKAQKPRKLFDEFGLGAFGLAVVFGILLGAIKIPLTAEGLSGTCFSLGNTGGPLIMALILGHFGHIGAISLKVPENVLKLFRELGLMLFLIGAGFEGGVELVDQITKSDLGALLILYGFIAGAVMTLVPMIVGFILAKNVFRLPLLNNLGSLTGGMTSTPALGTLIGVSGTDNVAAAYASTYPIALVLIVLASNLIGTLI